MNDASGVFVTMLLGVVIGILAGISMRQYVMIERYKLNQLIDECESELPSNQFCEIVVTARVKEEKQ